MLSENKIDAVNGNSAPICFHLGFRVLQYLITLQTSLFKLTGLINTIYYITRVLHLFKNQCSFSITADRILHT